ncbi:protein sorting system archaetidylserine decarboxylase [Halobacteria archaeon AArc-dxtr1]|nr:protein sorting system archaetidylserine decarboxylase [Halobacteria archaeon AArc-dxtr1]
MKFAPGAWRYALVPLLAAPFALLITVPAGVGLALLGLAVLAFFRDPERTTPPAGTVAPADGNVSVLRTEGDRTRLGIFMNVWHVHVVRAPFSGTVVDVEHVSGANKPAFSKDSDRNERVHVTVDLDEPGRLGPDVADEATVTFVAGAFARRIHPYVESGNRLARGDRLGHIAFGSRVDVLFPAGVSPADVAVERGEATTAGETVVLPNQRTPARSE